MTALPLPGLVPWLCSGPTPQPLSCQSAQEGAPALCSVLSRQRLPSGEAVSEHEKKGQPTPWVP